ncbi:hypothetical protein [Dactylosporangium darangshiense]|uniref:hypothetical protein n=1 Tax=Dactylosporangium darangshiense TaxID=579108 RepID=UPI0031E87657
MDFHNLSVGIESSTASANGRPDSSAAYSVSASNANASRSASTHTRSSRFRCSRGPTRNTIGAAIAVTVPSARRSVTASGATAARQTGPRTVTDFDAARSPLHRIVQTPTNPAGLIKRQLDAADAREQPV